MGRKFKNKILLIISLIALIVQIAFFIFNNMQYKYGIYPRRVLNIYLNINFSILIITAYILIKNFWLKKILIDKARSISNFIFKVIGLILGIILAFQFIKYFIFSSKEESFYDGNREVIKSKTFMFTNTIESYYEPINMLYKKVYFLSEKGVLNRLKDKYNEEFKIISSEEGEEGVVFYNVCNKNDEDIVFKVRNEYNFEDNYKEVYTLHYINKYLNENNLDREAKLNSSGVINIICKGKNDVESCSENIDRLIAFLQNQNLLRDNSVKIEVICKDTSSKEVLLTIQIGIKEENSIYYYKGKEALKADLIKNYQ